MTARWDRLPDETKVAAKKRRPNAPPTTYRCEGVRGCGLTMTCSSQEAERHADTHGGARLAIVLPERDTLPEPRNTDKRRGTE